VDRLLKLKGKRILIIGGTGYIGNNLAKDAVSKGMKVTSISRTKKRINKKLRGVEYFYQDITEDLSLCKIFKKDYDFVINLSGNVNHSDFFNQGDKVIKNHLFGLINIIKKINFKKCKKFINVGSSDEYGDIKSPQSENSKPKPLTSYAYAKFASNIFLDSLFRTKNLPFCSVRLFLVYGPDQNEDRFFPQIIKGCQSNKSFPVSSGNQIRDFCYITDVIEAFYKILLSDVSSGETFNIASGKPVKIKDLIVRIKNEIGNGKPEFGKLPYKQNEIMSLYADISKAKKMLFWSPKVSLQEGIKNILKSYL
tara:strand:- start:24508 stop:25434 length:927 start_codon:yes stop_codon:yes gene_type:complete